MPLSEEDKKEIGGLFKELMASEDFSKGLGKVVEVTVGKAVKAAQVEVDKKLEAAKTETDKKLDGFKPADPDKKADGGAGGPAIEDSPAFKKLQAQVEESNKRAEAQSKRAEDAEAARRAELLNNATRDALVAGGADPKRVPFALSHLREKGVIKLDDKTGAPVFVLKRDWGPENVAVEDAAKEWLATDDGKFFLPASGAQGTGEGAGRTQKPGGAVGDPSAIAFAALNQLF